MERPSVSIGMPTYNGSKYIGRALDSLLAQSYSDFELIISDNASTDDTGKICTGFAEKDGRIRYVRQKRNRGPVPNFNFVLDGARGKYFMWAADDDWWDRAFLEKCMAKFQADPGAVMVATNYTLLNEEGEVIRTQTHDVYFPFEANQYHRVKTYLLYWGGEKANLLYALWRRDVLLRNRTNFHHGWEKSYIFRNLVRGNSHLISEPLFFKLVKSPRSMPRKSFLKRAARTFSVRAQKIVSPYLYFYIVGIFSAERLTVAERLKLLFYTFFILVRLLFMRKA